MDRGAQRALATLTGSLALPASAGSSGAIDPEHDRHLAADDVLADRAKAQSFRDPHRGRSAYHEAHTSRSLARHSRRSGRSVSTRKTRPRRGEGSVAVAVAVAVGVAAT
jgi:hypothetical protein